MNAIVISLGGLHAGTLGCYGGEWVETAAIDRFAADAFVFDQCFVECPRAQVTRLNWWTGRLQCIPPDRSNQRQDPTASLLGAFRSQGVCTVLIRDTGLPVHGSDLHATGFEQIHEIERKQYDTTSKLFEMAARWLAEQPQERPFFLFLDCHGAHAPWLATESCDGDSRAADAARDAIASGDIEAENGHEIYDNDSSALSPATEQEIDPYLAAILHIDEQLGEFLDQLRASQQYDRSLIMITSDSRSVDDSVTQAGPLELAEAHIHIPLLVRHPNSEPAGRSPALVQPIDIVPTVLDAAGIAAPGRVHGRSLLPICRVELAQLRDVIHLAQAPVGGVRAIRTSTWYLVEAQSTSLDADNLGTSGPKLFAKPFDRWEQNDVAKQYPDVVAELQLTNPQDR